MNLTSRVTRNFSRGGGGRRSPKVVDPRVGYTSRLTFTQGKTILKDWKSFLFSFAKLIDEHPGPPPGTWPRTYGPPLIEAGLGAPLIYDRRLKYEFRHIDGAMSPRNNTSKRAYVWVQGDAKTGSRVINQSLRLDVSVRVPSWVHAHKHTRGRSIVRRPTASLWAGRNRTKQSVRLVQLVATVVVFFFFFFLFHIIYKGSRRANNDAWL